MRVTDRMVGDSKAATSLIAPPPHEWQLERALSLQALHYLEAAPGRTFVNLLFQELSEPWGFSYFQSLRRSSAASQKECFNLKEIAKQNFALSSDYSIFFCPFFPYIPWALERVSIAIWLSLSIWCREHWATKPEQQPLFSRAWPLPLFAYCKWEVSHSDQGWQHH